MSFNQFRAPLACSLAITSMVMITIAPVQARSVSGKLSVSQSAFRQLFDGQLKLQTGSKEFVQLTDRHQFHHPKTVKLLWSKTQHVYESAKWELSRKDKTAPGGRVLLLSQSIDNLPQTAGKNIYFNIDLKKKLPHKNTTDEKVEYLITVVGRLKNNPQVIKRTPVVLLSHLPISAQSQPARLNPYVCPPRRDNYNRRVTLRLQSLLSQNNTTTFNEGKDEVYFKVQGISFTAKKGLNFGSVEHQPGEDDHFSVVEGKKMHLGELLDVKGAEAFTHKYLNMAQRSQLAKFVIGHGEAVAITVNIQEDDMNTSGVKFALGAIMKAAEVVGTALGQAYVTAGAKAIDEIAIQPIPANHKDDLLGSFSVMFDNQCGFIRTTWVAASLIGTPGSKGVSQKFLFVKPSGQSQQVKSVLSDVSMLPTVMYADDPVNTKFNPYGWDNYDFGDFVTPAELNHSKNVKWNATNMILQTNGTSESSYLFGIKAFTEIPN